MLQDLYPEIHRIIDEHEIDSRYLNSNKTILSHYPKILILSVISYFEKKIKNCCSNIINNPVSSFIQPRKLQQIVSNNGSKYLDKIYAQLEGYMNLSGCEVLNATKFYDLFGGTNFLNDLHSTFSTVRTSLLNEYSTWLSNWATYFGTNLGDQFDNRYLEHEYIKDRLIILNFQESESSFLLLKLKRNIISHNYINGISDSFSDLKTIYYDANPYIQSLIIELKKLTTVS